MNNKEKNFISIIVYLYNCEKQLIHFLEVLERQIGSNFEHYEIICVNDNSSDESVAKLKYYAQKENAPVITLINMSYFQGIEACMNAGIDFAIGDFIFEFDTVSVDYEENLILDIYHKSQEGFDIVSTANTKAKRLTTSLFYHLFNANFESSICLQNETFRILSRRVVNRIKNMSIASIYRKAMYATCGLKSITISYIPIEIGTTLKTKALGSARKKLAMNSLLLYTDLAYKISVLGAVIFILNMIGVGVFAIFICNTNTSFLIAVPILLLVSAGFAGLFLLGAVILKYLILLIDLVYRRQNYIYDSVEKVKV